MCGIFFCRNLSKLSFCQLLQLLLILRKCLGNLLSPHKQYIPPHTITLTSCHACCHESQLPTFLPIVRTKTPKPQSCHCTCKSQDARHEHHEDASLSLISFFLAVWDDGSVGVGNFHVNCFPAESSKNAKKRKFRYMACYRMLECSVLSLNNIDFSNKYVYTDLFEKHKGTVYSAQKCTYPAFLGF